MTPAREGAGIGLEALVGKSIAQWQVLYRERLSQPETIRPVVTVSRMCGSHGGLLARQLAEALGLTYYSGSIIDLISKDTRLSAMVLHSFDEQPRSLIDEFVSMYFSDAGLSSDEYLTYLVRVIGAIGEAGNAVILGRGANLILAHLPIFRVRCVAPHEVRVKNLMAAAKLKEAEACKRIGVVDRNRALFVKRYFEADIDDATHADLVLNTGTMSIETCVKVVRAALPWPTPSRS